MRALAAKDAVRGQIAAIETRTTEVAQAMASASARNSGGYSGGYSSVNQVDRQVSMQQAQQVRNDQGQASRQQATQSYQQSQQRINNTFDSLITKMRKCCNPSRFNDCGANCPVEQVSWNDTLSAMTEQVIV